MHRFAPEGKELPQERRPGLGRKPAPFPPKLNMQYKNFLGHPSSFFLGLGGSNLREAKENIVCKTQIFLT